MNVCGMYAVGQEIASGSQGSVFCAHPGEGDVTYAVKITEFNGCRRSYDRFQEEALVTEILQGHRNIVHLVASEVVEDLYGCIVMELADCDLLDYIGRRSLSEEDIKAMFFQLCDAVAHCHSNGIAHRDLKPENILMVNGTPRLADFGCAMDTFVEGETCFKRCGTVMYAAPEVLQGRPEGYNCLSADVWSLGVLLHVLTTGCWPFRAPCDVSRGNLLIEEHLFSEGALSLLKFMLNLDTAERPNIAQVLAHPYFRVGPVTPSDVVGREQSEGESTPEQCSPRSHTSEGVEARRHSSRLYAVKNRFNSLMNFDSQKAALGKQRGLTHRLLRKSRA